MSGIGHRFPLQAQHIDGAIADVRKEMADLLGVPTTDIDVTTSKESVGWHVQGWWNPEWGTP